MKYTKGVLKFDSSNLKYNQNGYLIIDALVAKVGVVSRWDSQLNIQRNELINEDNLFALNSLETLKYLPVTQYHPEINGKRILIDETNTLDFQRGFSMENPTKYIENGNIYLKVTLIIQDKALIEDIINNITPEVSLGYTSSDIPEKGIFNEKEFNFIQTNRINNHIALERNGINRSGSDVRVKTDSNEYFYDDNNNCEVKTTMDLVKIKCDSKEIEVTPVAQVVLEAKFKADSQKNLDYESKLKEMQNKYDSLEGKYDEAKETIIKLDSYKEKFEKQENEVLIKQVTPFLGNDFKFDGLSSLEIKKQVLGKIKPNLDLKEKTDSYIIGRFDGIIEDFKYDSQDKEHQISLNIPAVLAGAKKTDSKKSVAQSIIDEITGV